VAVSGVVLIVASHKTREVDGVIDLLRERGLEIVRFCPCQYPGLDLYSWRPDEGSELGKPRAAWLCDFSGWSVETELTGLQREVALAEATAFAEGLFLSLDAHWLNAPHAVRSASRKLYQLAIVQRLKIPIPITCITNDPSAAKRFCTDHDRVVAKALATSFISYGENSLKLYTRAVDTNSDPIFEALRAGPLIFQKYIAKQAEVRAIVIDDNVVLVKVDLSALDDVIDIRTLNYADERTRFQHCTDRGDIVDASRQIVSALGLSYGCIDWAIEADSSMVFLECNPLGAFKWFELCSGQDITRMIAASLEQRCTQ
jgi:glutathione synthase/RimK-type ligase-like ATP-grasp enzyme